MAQHSRPACAHAVVRRRRQALQALALLLCLPAARRARAAPYPATIAAMHSAREAETSVYVHYTEFARRAQAEGYRGVAYLFTAFAASEGVHASNFGKVLVQLGVALAPVPKPAVRAGTTRENLIMAANGEMSSIESFYPQLLEQLRPEGHVEAMTTVRYAWNSEKQHRDKIAQIQRWTGAFFEQVARTIDDKTGRYFICQICGSTVNAVPAGPCPVCTSPPTHYRGIEPPG